MRYFVLTIDGSKFGPADPATLADWVRQGRITADSLLEQEIGFGRTTVAAVLAEAGLGIPSPEIDRRVEPPAGVGSTLIWARIWLALGTLAFLASFYAIASIVAIGLTSVSIHLSKRACAAGNAGGQSALVFGSVILMLSLAALCAHFVYGF